MTQASGNSTGVQWEQTLEQWMENPFLLWGIGPSMIILVTYLVTVAILEWVIRQDWCHHYLLVYRSKENRLDQIQNIYNTKGMSVKEQFTSGLWQVAGPLNLVGCIFNGLVFPMVIPKHAEMFPEWKQLSIDVVLLAFVADFFLYWGHRIQHEIPYLWENFHSVHHRLSTPSPVGTIYIDSNDPLIQAGIPIIVCALIVRPHPMSYYVYVSFHLANNVFNHSGIDAWWFDLLTLKFLPLRSKNSHHDAHHRFTNFGKNAKNFGEMFWLWDYVFQTMGKSAKLARKQKAKGQ